MSSSLPTESKPKKLSICITTRNRAKFIGETLESIVSQVTDDCEIVVVDGASTDGTSQVLSEFAQRFDQLRYFRQTVNNGVDRGFNEAVERSQGEYCWLMPDDDLLKPHAISTVLQALNRAYSLVVVNVEYRSFDLSTVLRYDDLGMGISSNREIRAGDIDGLFETCWKLIRYSGSIVIKRSIWLARERERYYDTYWTDVAVIFQESLPGPALVVAEPLVSVRMDNQAWLSKWFEVFCVTWPALVQSLPLSESARQKACADEPWTKLRVLLLARAAGQYSLSEYRQYARERVHSIPARLSAALVAVLPGAALNTCFMLYYLVARRRDNARTMLLLLTQSRFCIRKWRIPEIA